MPRPPLAREKVLDAFEAILIDEGERAATLEATAKAAGVSKGGLLYHFRSKDDLEAGLLERLDHLTTLDLERMRTADEGPVAYYVRTSVMEDDALDRALIATTRLAQGGSTAASDMLRDTRRRWAETIRPHVRDTASLDLVMLVSDGLYFNNSLDVHGPERLVPRSDELADLIALVLRATA
ncbi:TetR/AcrR family transcriptional regulator [Microbacterium sp. HSID17254]|uniref:TetR/AcrR family transcriptional regulator n=1 Tax=Microbacterium paraoxydans TaxID=199592 RepID=A0ABZ2HNB7_9MICO|nr:MULTISPECIES: TetR/AcrR family transcriptional regulator [Microbacterium]AMG84365.1 transcriptional regulator [Microbacterium sp. PAMC 28756]MCT1394194.1 TetR/AcrR family transcriptional regulator [Microbacterium sp. p3-SID338]PMC01870.1 DNA-binding transcriptional repressor AcrR [Microbacterium sp. UMB0228]QXE31265.1 TetR/AcrR family transcriptional regulator [Microbacterium paraoxydans]RUQ08054.1 TetR/AcrR family transcriptional regulator [Microbacterium sp. HSID17254]